MTVRRSGTCSKLTIKKPERRHSVFIVNFIVNFTYSGVFIINFEHVSHLARREICRNMSFILEKIKKSNKFNHGIIIVRFIVPWFNRLQIELFFLPNISPPPYTIPPPSPPVNSFYCESKLYSLYSLSSTSISIFLKAIFFLIFLALICNNILQEVSYRSCLYHRKLRFFLLTGS